MSGKTSSNLINIKKCCKVLNYIDFKVLSNNNVLIVTLEKLASYKLNYLMTVFHIITSQSPYKRML